MKLSRFIAEHTEEILADWEALAKTLEPAAVLMTSEALRDHAHQIINAIALDIESLQTDAQQTAKSLRDGPAKFPQSCLPPWHAARGQRLFTRAVDGRVPLVARKCPSPVVADRWISTGTFTRS